MYTLKLYYQDGINKGNLREIKEVNTIEEVKEIWKAEKVKPTVWQNGERLEGY